MRRQGGHSQMHMAEVVLKNLKKIYPNTEKKKKKGEPEKKNDLQISDEGVVAVQDFNLHIADKEFIVLVGPSGCGKSTTLRMIAGLEDISGGELYIDGKLMNDVEPKDRDIAMVFLLISTHFTATLGIPLTPPALQPHSFKSSSGVEPRIFTSDLHGHLHSLYTQ